jgi:hypothetical protein
VGFRSALSVPSFGRHRASLQPHANELNGFSLRFIKAVDPDLLDEKRQAHAALDLLQEASVSKQRVIADKSRLMILTVIFVAASMFAYVALVGLLLASLL